MKVKAEGRRMGGLRVWGLPFARLEKVKAGGRMIGWVSGGGAVEVEKGFAIWEFGGVGGV